MCNHVVDLAAGMWRKWMESQNAKPEPSGQGENWKKAKWFQGSWMTRKRDKCSGRGWMDGNSQVARNQENSRSQVDSNEGSWA